MNLVAIRGAITANDNTKQTIIEETTELLLALMEANGLKTEDIIQITFSATKDLTTAYPAVAARNLGITEASLMCMQEMYVLGALARCIRVSVLTNSETLTQQTVKHQYLKGAKILRPDILRK
ncbi:MAG: chorismate mutase [Cellulosilyticaceae bacterium]